MQTVDYKCPNCKATLRFNPKKGNWVCDYCGSDLTLKDLKTNDETFKKTKVKSKKVITMDGYQCKNCGAKIAVDENVAATSCIYCKSTAILKDKLTEEFEPKYVIPFSNIKQDAINAFKNVCKGKILAPKEFSDEKNIQEMTGIYIPFWLIDCKVDGDIEANAKKVSTFKVGDYMHTKTDVYSAIRSGEIEFNKIPVDGSIRFDDAIMNSIEPFDYNGLQEFNHSYLSGFLAEKYDVDKEKGSESTDKRAKETLTDQLKGQLREYTSYTLKNTNINVNNTNVDYVLLPVWMLNIKYKDKIYTFAMNGQTGKLIGDIPWNKTKAAIMFIGIFLLVTIILALTIFGGVL